MPTPTGKDGCRGDAPAQSPDRSRFSVGVDPVSGLLQMPLLPLMLLPLMLLPLLLLLLLMLLLLLLLLLL